MKLLKIYNISYFNPGYVWEVLKVAIQSTMNCLLKFTTRCNLNLDGVEFGVYPLNLVTILVVYMSSVLIASLYLQLVYGSTLMVLRDGLWSVGRKTYNVVMVAAFVLYLSVVSVSISDLILISLIAFSSGIWYGSECTDKTDSCLFVAVALPTGSVRVLVGFVMIFFRTVMIFVMILIRQFRLLTLLSIGITLYGPNVYGPDQLIAIGYKLSNSSSMIPELWFVLASLASIARSIILVLWEISTNNLYLIILFFHLVNSRILVLIVSLVFSLVGFVLASDTLWIQRTIGPCLM